jgi:hypothetical protein
MVENGLDVVIRPDRITIDARISPEQVRLVEAGTATQPATEQRVEWVRKHAAYVRDHLTVRVDGHLAPGVSIEATNPQALETAAGGSAGSTGSTLVPYRLEYPLNSPPGVVQIDQSFLREFNAWSASCVLRIRQVDDAAFDTALLTRERTAEFDCVWPPGPATRPSDESVARPIQTNVKLWSTIRAYTAHGILHILSGYDHLLFVSALVLAAKRRRR